MKLELSEVESHAVGSGGIGPFLARKQTQREHRVRGDAQVEGLVNQQTN